jgi:hypothetical protein
VNGGYPVSVIVIVEVSRTVRVSVAVMLPLKVNPVAVTLNVS